MKKISIIACLCIFFLTTCNIDPPEELFGTWQLNGKETWIKFEKGWTGTTAEKWSMGNTGETLPTASGNFTLTKTTISLNRTDNQGLTFAEHGTIDYILSSSTLTLSNSKGSGIIPVGIYTKQ